MAIAFDIETECAGGCGRVGVGDMCGECEEAAQMRCIACGGNAATPSVSGGVYYPELCPCCAAEERAEREAAECGVCGAGSEANHRSCRTTLALRDIADNQGECAREAF